MLKIEPPFREQKSSGMIRIPVADRLGQKSMERKKKRKKKRSLSLMNNDKQRHLVTTHVYIGVTWRWPLCQSLCLLSNRLENRVHLSDGNVTWNQKPGLRWRHESVKTFDNQSSHPKHVFRFALGGWLLNAVKFKKATENKNCIPGKGWKETLSSSPGATLDMHRLLCLLVLPLFC